MTKKHISISAVIPTKNRHFDLLKAVNSVINQTILPSTLVIVDQSNSNDSQLIIEEKFKNSKTHLIYIYDKNVSGLVDAKRVGVNHSNTDIVVFLEDDVILEPDFIDQIELGFINQPEMIGCCGIITNPPKQTALYELLFKIFHRGIFMDKRVGLYGRFSGRGNKLILSEMLSGGLSAWRRDVFKSISFDVANGFHMFEDIDFSTRVARHFGPLLFINPNARLEHHCSPVNREVLGPRQRRKLTECIVYFKKRRGWQWAKFALTWLLFGMFLEALLQSYSARSFEPIHGYLLGLRDGFAKKVIIS